MCGIFGYIGKRTDAPTLVLEGLKSLEYRGYDSWGVAVVPTALNDRIVVKKKAGKIGNASVADMPPGSLAFGHTRWATHGGVTDLNAHPHLDCTQTIALIHNGIVENYEILKKELLAKNHTFISETDTEIVVHLIEELAKTFAFADAVKTAFNQLEGLNAIIVINTKNRELIACRNGSPLVIGFGKDENFLASDAAALIPYTKTVYFMEDDEMVQISDTAVMVTNVKTNQTYAPKTQILEWSIAQVTLGNYPHYMLKEIHEQPQILTEIAAKANSETQKMAGIIKNSFGSYIIGCGTAAHAAITGTYLFSKIAKFHINWAIGSEFGYQLDFLTDKSLIVALSQSGETMDTLESVKKAKDKGTKIFALLNVLGSTLYRESQYKMLINAGPEKSVASTKAFTGKLAHLTLLAYALAGKLDQGKQVIQKAAAAAQKILSEEMTQSIHNLAKQLKDKKDMYVIGRGLSYPAALETALKIKEISYIHAEGLAAGELKHGPLALIEPGTPCIAFVPKDETHGANLAGAMEMKARGGMIIGIADEPHEIFDHYIPVADAEEATIIPNVIVGQLLAYYLTIEKGLDPDKPRNLAKSVTVK